MIRLLILLFTLTLGTYSRANTEHMHTDKQEGTLLSTAGHTLSLAKKNEQRAVEVLKNANLLRGTINELRAQERNAKAGTDIEFLKTHVNLLAEQLQLWQSEGAHLRQTASELRATAAELLPVGFKALWPKKLTYSGILGLAGSEQMSMSHNTMIRSVHPSMLGKMTDGTETETANDMTLAMPTMSGQSTPEQLNISSFQVSRDLNYFAHIEPVLLHENSAGMIPLNEIHQWHLFVANRLGEPVTDATITFAGHMPGHVHGLPTQPRVMNETAPGVYLVDGVKFQMKGWWVIEFAIQSEGQSDSFVFNLSL